MSTDEYTPRIEDIFRAAQRDGITAAEWGRWLAERDRQVAEQAWDEAYQAGAYDTLGSPRDARENPYRADCPDCDGGPERPCTWSAYNDGAGHQDAACNHTKDDR